MSSTEITYEILEEIAILPKDREGKKTKWGLEVNLVTWNNKEPGVDIRWWSENRERVGKGVNISKRDAELLCLALQEYLKSS